MPKLTFVSYDEESARSLWDRWSNGELIGANRPAHRVVTASSCFNGVSTSAMSNRARAMIPVNKSHTIVREVLGDMVPQLREAAPSMLLEQQADLLLQPQPMFMLHPFPSSGTTLQLIGAAMRFYQRDSALLTYNKLKELGATPSEAFLMSHLLTFAPSLAGDSTFDGRALLQKLGDFSARAHQGQMESVPVGAYAAGDESLSILRGNNVLLSERAISLIEMLRVQLGPYFHPNKVLSKITVNVPDVHRNGRADYISMVQHLMVPEIMDNIHEEADAQVHYAAPRLSRRCSDSTVTADMIRQAADEAGVPQQLRDILLPLCSSRPMQANELLGAAQAAWGIFLQAQRIQEREGCFFEQRAYELTKEYLEQRGTFTEQTGEVA